MLAYSSIAQAGYITMAFVIVSYTHVDSVVNLAMGGTWQVHVFITPKEGKKIRAKTSLNI